MITTIVGILVLLALFALFVWLATRAGRARKAFIKWPGMILSGLLGLLFLTALAVTLVGVYRMNVSPYTYQKPDLQVALTSDKIQRGERLAHICIGCHSPDGSLPLSGSKENMLTGTPFGVMYAPNLTSAGLKTWTDAEIVRALREGVDQNSHPLLLMPSPAFHNVSDEDAQALVAYLRSQPEVSHDVPKRDLSLAGYLLVGTGMFPSSAQLPITQPVVAPPSGTSQYGKYLTAAFGCHDCHGPSLAGGTNPNLPQGPNLTTAVKTWSQADFLQLFNVGKLPGGQTISESMPRQDYRAAFTDQELVDIYNYLYTTQPLPNN